MRSILFTTTLVLLGMAAAFGYAAFYSANSGELDIADGLFATFAVPFAIGGVIAAFGWFATPEPRLDRRHYRR